MPWHALRVKFGSEAEVEQGLTEAGIAALVPLHTTEWVARGMVHRRTVPLYPTYVLAYWERGDSAAWHAACDREGVLGILGGADPQAIPDIYIDNLRSLMSTDHVVDVARLGTDLAARLRAMRYGYAVGDEVRIVPPAKRHWIGRRGIVKSFEVQGTYVTLPPMLGQPMTILVPSRACELV